MSDGQDRKGLALIVLTMGVFGISSGAIFARWAEAPPLVIAFYRVAVASAVMLPLFLAGHRKELQKLTRADLIKLLLPGLFLGLYFATWITPHSYTSVASSVVIVETIPIWVAILSPFVSHEKLSKLAWTGVAVSFTGVTIISAGDFGLGGKELFGDFLALVGAWCGCLYILFGRVLRQKINLTAYTALCYGTAAACLLVIVLVARLPLTGFGLPTWGTFLGMGLVSQIMGHSSYNWSLGYLSAGMVSMALLGEPILCTIFAYFLFGESVTTAKLVGGALILAGIILAARAEKGPEPAAVAD